MTDAVQIDLLPLITEAEHPQYLLNRKPAGTNACGVFTENEDFDYEAETPKGEWV